MKNEEYMPVYFTFLSNQLKTPNFYKSGSINSRLLLKLSPFQAAQIIVSRERMTNFKKWLLRKVFKLKRKKPLPKYNYFDNG